MCFKLLPCFFKAALIQSTLGLHTSSPQALPRNDSSLPASHEPPTTNTVTPRNPAINRSNVLEPTTLCRNVLFSAESNSPRPKAQSITHQSDPQQAPTLLFIRSNMIPGMTTFPAPSCFLRAIHFNGPLERGSRVSS